jgi:hypothetical protein
MGENNNYSAVFFDVNKSRQTPNNLDKKVETALSEEKSPEIELTSTTGEKTGGFLNSLRTLSTPKTMFKIGGSVAEDIRMTAVAFNKCIIDMKRITGDDFCPQKPADDILFDGFDDNVMPRLSCEESLSTESTIDKTIPMTSSTTTGTGGKKTLKRRKHRKQNKKSIKRKTRRR